MILMTLIFSLFGIVAWVIAGVLLYFRRKTLAKTKLMRGVQTSPASEVSATAPGTLVEVKGTLRCEEPLTSEMAEKTCAYYLSQVVRVYEVTDRDSDGDSRTSRRSEVVASNERFAPFVVEDESGAVGVRGEGAEVDALEVMNRFERETGGAGTITLGGVTVNLGGGARTPWLPLRGEDLAPGLAGLRARGRPGGRAGRGALRGGSGREVPDELPLRGATREEIQARCPLAGLDSCGSVSLRADLPGRRRGQRRQRSVIPLS